MNHHVREYLNNKLQLTCESWSENIGPEYFRLSVHLQKTIAFPQKTKQKTTTKIQQTKQCGQNPVLLVDKSFIVRFVWQLCYIKRKISLPGTCSLFCVKLLMGEIEILVTSIMC